MEHQTETTKQIEKSETDEPAFLRVANARPY